MQLDALVHDAAILQAEAQAHLHDLIGSGTRFDGSWSVDLGLGRFSQSSTTSDETFTARAGLLGSAAPGPGSWLWAWANPQHDGPVAEAARLVRDLGERLQVAELTSAEVPLGERAPRDVAWRMGAAAILALGPWPTYTFDAGGGTVGALVLTSEALRLPAPSTPRLLRCIGEAAQSHGLGRSSVLTWASQRGVTATPTPDGLLLRLADGDVAVRLDERDRVVGMTGSSRPA
ncbi:DUF6882 domain-containing protein [Agrococcus sp. SGAir0287]|uniref:DUF6882 domain-containing protein n=1 Tax=Agrococcus sp. SGAir0287 TaxID=2070347 RepID=UPI0010CCE2DF|nr:DUF6882 domain-containing protein [Agrococcus sp. SGAir0287]QCR20046.1 hypothetical protein C1N71_11865 [Agrococcus sp. SGAir0287]